MPEMGLHTVRPSVYLDQWVWLRLAKADQGEPREESDLAVLAAVRQASDAGVVFPLSSTHYMETSKITDPGKRAVWRALWRRSRTAGHSGQPGFCCGTRCSRPCT